MDADLADFSAAQQRALCDLVLAIHADGQLPTTADEAWTKVLNSMGHFEETARQHEIEPIVAQLQPLAKSILNAKDRANTFTVRSQQKRVYGAVQQIVTQDKHFSTWENTLLTELRLKFRI